MFNLICSIMEKVHDFRKYVLELLGSEHVNGKIKPSLQALVTALMQVEFVAFCLNDDGESVFDENV